MFGDVFSKAQLNELLEYARVEDCRGLREGRGLRGGGYKQQDFQGRSCLKEATVNLSAIQDPQHLLLLRGVSGYVYSVLGGCWIDPFLSYLAFQVSRTISGG